MPNKNNIFKNDLPSHLKKAIGNLKKDGPEFDILKQVCKSLKLKYNSPGIVNGIAVHFAIEDHKLAILFESSGPWNKRKAEMIKHGGWIPSIIPAYEIVRSGFESIKAQMIELIREKK
jgi:hypothetical protein